MTGRIGIPVSGRPHLRILQGLFHPDMEPRSDAEERASQLLLLAVCPRCGSQERIAVDARGAVAWTRGELVQKALPSLTQVQRERLLTGFCDPCWQVVMAPPDDDC